MPETRLNEAAAEAEGQRAPAVADALHAEASRLLRERGIGDLLRSYGHLIYTGSYALNVMAWPDIDLHLVMEPDSLSLDRFFELGRELARLDGVDRLNFRNTCRAPVNGLPGGLYWGMRLDAGAPSTTWKVDLWATEADDLEANLALMSRFQEAMDGPSRRLIVQTKRALLTPAGRTPVLSGIHIYEAILFRGLRSLDDIRSYLREQGVDGV
ncbi:MAG: hypothetical protein ISS72_07330 [Candidatus Brocadiae bacterium]|nr:hypothetical protein [Candidatus Brocadiia bacterium]